MIKYTLICEGDHEFEIWFSKSSDFDDQAPKGLIVCPYCGSTRVQKGIMAPNVSTSRKKEAAASKRKKAMTMMNKAAADLHEEGVGIAPLPDIFTPKPKSEQN